MINELILRVDYEGQTYDLIVDNEVPLRIDMSAVESQDFGKFFGIGSQTFSLPGTKETNRFFNYAYDVSTDDVPGFYNTLDCSVILNGETVLIGALQLVSVVTNDEGFVTYQVQVADKVLQFEQVLSSLLIKNADWSSYEHTLTSQSVIDSWDNNLLSGSVYYPVVDYGRTQAESFYIDAPIMQLTSSIPEMAGGYIGDPNSPMRLNQVLPAVKVKDTLDVIFSQAGFSYTGSFVETDDFNSLYILNKPKEGLGVITTGSTNADFSAINGFSQQEPSGDNFIVRLTTEVSDPSNSYDTNNSTYTIPESGNYTFQGQVGFFNPVPVTSSAQVQVALYLVIGETASPDNAIVLDQATLFMDQSTGTGPFYLNVSYTNALAAGLDIRLQGFIEQYTGPPIINTTFVSTYTQFKAINTPITYEGATVDMSEQWQSDTKSIDILKGLLNQFNLVMTPETGNKSVIRIETFNDWIRSGEIKDWTDKYDTAKRISIEHTVDQLEKEIFLKNVDDNDRFSVLTKESDPNLQYGTLRLLADNNVSQGSKNVESYFSPIILAGSVDFIPNVSGSAAFQGTYDINLGTRFVIPHIYKWNNKSQESYISKPRLGYKVTAPLLPGSGFYLEDSQITGSYTTISNLSALPAVSGSSNDLHFNNTYTNFSGAGLNLNDGVSAFNRYWKTYYDSLYWEGAKIVTLDLFFNEYEYKDIQLNDRILIKGQAYRINKISGFNVSHRDVVKVELIKLYPAYWTLGSGTNPIPPPPPIDPCDCIETGSCTAHTVYPGYADYVAACDQTETPITVYTDNTVWEDSTFLFTDCGTGAYTLSDSTVLQKDGYILLGGSESSTCSNLATGLLCADSASFTYSANIEGICDSVTNAMLYTTGSATNQPTLRIDESTQVYSDAGFTTPAADGYYKYGSMILRVVSGATVSPYSGGSGSLYTTVANNMGYCEYPCLYS